MIRMRKHEYTRGLQPCESSLQDGEASCELQSGFFGDLSWDERVSGHLEVRFLEGEHVFNHLRFAINIL